MSQQRLVPILLLTGFGLAVRLGVRECPRRRGLGVAERFRLGGFKLCAIITIITGVARARPVVEYGKFSQYVVKFLLVVDPWRYIIQ
jgi:hypothetical protein